MVDHWIVLLKVKVSFVDKKSGSQKTKGPKQYSQYQLSLYPGGKVKKKTA
jgi:hypothetical protein